MALRWSLEKDSPGRPSEEGSGEGAEPGLVHRGYALAPVEATAMR
jgi:hypothetical protein